MFGFFQSFLPIVKRFKKYKIEIFLLTIAFLTASLSAGLYLAGGKETTKEKEIFEAPSTKQRREPIIVDINGAVEKPDVYEVSAGARLKDVLLMAGGLSAEADRQFFSRHFNLARIITDQEKIYIPSVVEVQNNLFAPNEGRLVNINAASLDELDQLPGVGKVTAQKIIDNRPYQSIEELLTKKVVKKNIYEEIKDLLSVN